ncbi:hypothetical protein [Aquimarina sp. 2201CG14-23]|uniref:hypothetical protein n=1 Tax=Aquimarina mycalae TaxID=3040073 RepID=UPI0024781E0B|nr:hypothetical protein [Aquimarina sp. 2201CG14-23]MDH7447038.1 hypothetical protein [Aquimarina sp. 2201CG14-23]
MKQQIIILLILFLGISSCTQNNEFNIAEKEKSVQEIQLMLEKYHYDISKKGLTAEFKYLDNSSDFFWVPPGYSSALSYDSVKTILQANAKGFTSIKFHWDTLKIYPLSKTTANYSGIVGGYMIDTAGTRSDISIIESGTFIKRKDGWKFLSGQSAMLDTKSKQ